jgi:ElaA protein
LAPNVAWRFAPFAELAPREVHDLYQLRAAAFVVEQKCAFQDIDGVDPECWHLLGYSPSPPGSPLMGAGLNAEGREEGQLLAYSRLIPPGTKFAEPSIGRVITATAVRRTGMGRELMRESLRRAEKLWPNRAIRIGAQLHLERFYVDFGFVTASEPYDEDGILHIEMLRPASTIAGGGPPPKVGPLDTAQLAGQK